MGSGYGNSTLEHGDIWLVRTRLDINECGWSIELLRYCEIALEGITGYVSTADLDGTSHVTSRTAFHGGTLRPPMNMSFLDFASFSWWAWRLRRSGIFDRHYYEGQLRQRFTSDKEAIQYFLSSPDRGGYSFHPLIEPAWMKLFSKLEGDPWHRVLFRHGRRVSLSPLFDARDGSSSRSVLWRVRSSAGVLREFLGHADSLAELPVSDHVRGPVRWSHARSHLIRCSRVYVRQDTTSSRRNAHAWDFKREQEYLANLSRVPDTSDEVFVSIVMPTHNRASVLGEAIRSVLAQTFKSWELVVVDDGSTDETHQVVSRAKELDRRVRFVSQPNAGVSAARNRGISFARGEYLAFLDSDNVWKPDFLEIALAAQHTHGRVASYSAVQIELDGGEKEYLGVPTTFRELLEGRNQVDLNALVIRRDVIDQIGNFDSSLRRWVDFDLVLRVARWFDLEFVPVVGVIYDHRASAGDRITTTESPLWRNVVLEKHLVDWAHADSTAQDRVRGRVSVLIRTHRQWPSTLKTVRSLLSFSDDDIEVIVIDNASPREEFAILTGAFLGEPRVTVRRVASDLRVPASTNLAFVQSTGDTIVVMMPGTIVHAGWVAAVRRAVVNSDTKVAFADSIGLDGALLAASAQAFLDRRGLAPMSTEGWANEGLQLRRPASA